MKYIKFKATVMIQLFNSNQQIKLSGSEWKKS